jgi:hypothetical protein
MLYGIILIFEALSCAATRLITKNTIPYKGGWRASLMRFFILTTWRNKDLHF